VLGGVGLSGCRWVISMVVKENSNGSAGCNLAWEVSDGLSGVICLTGISKVGL
jgi:hypothetical protein